jgi:outer membrane lipoprotein carrier protein
MSRFILTVLALALLMLVGAPAIAEPETGEDAALLRQAIDGIHAFYAEKQGLQVLFSQRVRRRYRPGNSEGMERTGMAWFMKPGKMRWDYHSPNPVHYVSDGEVLWVYEVEEGVAYRGQVRGSRLYDSMKFLFGEGRLDQEFDITLEGSTDTEISIRMTPRSGQQAFQSLVLVVNRSDWEIQRSVLTDPAGDASEIVFKKVAYGAISNPNLFQWKPSSDIIVHELGTRSEVSP